MGSAGKIDWSKAGKRLRFSLAKPGEGNPDWNWVAQRWKVAEEYAADELVAEEIVKAVACPRDGCLAPAWHDCRDARGEVMFDAPHQERRFAAGAAMIEKGWKL
jgi:hypothetical protein